MILNLGSYCTFNRVIRKIFETVPLIESLFYVVNSSKIQKYDLFSMRSYCTFNRVILKNVQTVRLIETWLIIETIEYSDYVLWMHGQMLDNTMYSLALLDKR